MLKDREKYNAYLNEYMKKRWEKRRRTAVEKLGGKCVHCGSVENLEFDHVDPSTKKFTIGIGSSFSEVRFWAEVDKCQLLCGDCHKLKSKTDGSSLNRKKLYLCGCGRKLFTTKQYAGHRTTCKV